MHQSPPSFLASLRCTQEAELRARPDIVVCTPGRMVDHLTNSASVHMDDVEILVLDEVQIMVTNFYVKCILLYDPEVQRVWTLDTYEYTVLI